MNLDIIQTNALEKLRMLRAGALFMRMGTGKTKVALELAASRQSDFDAVVWIAPASLLATSSYHDEIDKWRSGLARHIDFFTVEGVSQSDRKYLELRALAESKRVFCVVDESITIKNNIAKRTERLLSMWDLFAFRLILNGMPLSRSLLDLYSQIQFLHPKILNADERTFAERYLVFREEGGRRPWHRWSLPANEQALIETIRPYIFDAELDIPVRLSSENLYFDLSSTEREQYDEVKRKFIESGAFDFLAMAQKFQSTYTACATKIDALKKLALSSDEQFIIYVKFHHELDTILASIPGCIEYSGRRKDDLSDFTNGRARVLVMTYGSGAMGLNLQSCHNVIFFTQTFDAKDKTQALYRVYRTGQTSDVFVHEFWVTTGLEQLIRKSLDKKQSTLANVEKFIKQHGVEGL